MPTTSGFRPELLRAAREAQGWTKPQLIRKLRTAATHRRMALVGDASLSRAISGWENGHHYPAQYVDLLTDVYGRAAHELGLAEPSTDTLTIPDAEYPASSTDAAEAASQLWRADLHPAAPLTDLVLEEASWRSATLAWLIAPDGEPLPASRSVAQVGMGDVDAVRSTIAMFGDMDNRFGGGHARRSLIQYLSSDVSQLLTARYTEDVGRALFSTVAEGCLLAGWMSYDSDDHALAQRYLLHAQRFAQVGDDRRLAGTVLSAMSHQATYLGMTTQSVDIARAALAGIKGNATPTLTAQFRAMEARALARAGDAAACQRALAQAATALDQHTDGDEDPEWIAYFDQAELSAEFGHCFRDLAMPGQAAEHARVSICGSSARSDFFVTIVLADALLAQGDDEQACAVALQALDAGEQLKSARCLTYLSDFRARLDRLGNARTVRTFREQAAGSRLWQRAS